MKIKIYEKTSIQYNFSNNVFYISNINFKAYTMNSTQMIHIGMLNSYNVLMEKASIEEVIASGIGVFAHTNDEKSAMESIEFVMFYFKELEMYDKCADLKNYIEKTFNKDGTYKESCCKCDMPEIEEYTTKVKCSICNLRLVK